MQVYLSQLKSNFQNVFPFKGPKKYGKQADSSYENEFCINIYNEQISACGSNKLDEGYLYKKDKMKYLRGNLLRVNYVFINIFRRKTLNLSAET